MLFFVLILYIGRLNSSYHPHLLYRKYIRINNDILKKILIDKSLPCGSSIYRKNNKNNLNKLSIIGLIYYIVAFLWFVFYLIYIKFYNDEFPIILASFLMLLGFLTYLINGSQIIKEYPYAKLNTFINYIGIFIFGIFTLILLIGSIYCLIN